MRQALHVVLSPFFIQDMDVLLLRLIKDTSCRLDVINHGVISVKVESHVLTLGRPNTCTALHVIHQTQMAQHREWVVHQVHLRRDLIAQRRYND